MRIKKKKKTTPTEWKSLLTQVKIISKLVKSLQKSEFHFWWELTERQLETKELSLSEFPHESKIHSLGLIFTLFGLIFTRFEMIFTRFESDFTQ